MKAYKIMLTQEMFYE